MWWIIGKSTTKKKKRSKMTDNLKLKKMPSNGAIVCDCCRTSSHTMCTHTYFFARCMAQRKTTERMYEYSWMWPKGGFWLNMTDVLFILRGHCFFYRHFFLNTVLCVWIDLYTLLVLFTRHMLLRNIVWFRHINIVCCTVPNDRPFYKASTYKFQYLSHSILKTNN